jgi:hypothetical protein
MKKGIVPLWISLFFGALAVVLLIAFYFIFVNGAKEAHVQIIEESHSATAQTVLLGYLNAPVLVEGETVTFANVVRLWYNDRPRYQATLVRATEEFMRANDVYRDPGSAEQRRVFWVNIYEQLQSPYRGLQSLLKINQPPATFSGAARGRAVGTVQVSETHVVMIELWSDRQ